MKDYVSLSDPYFLVPKFDQDGRMYPASLIIRIFDRIYNEDADIVRSQEISAEEIQRWEESGRLQDEID